MNPRNVILRFLLLFMLLAEVLISGCGGGGSTGGSSPSIAAKTLSWEPPATYTDSTPLDPSVHLDRFEIYVNESGNFSTRDEANAALAAFDPGTDRLTTSFNLTNLSPYLSKGVTYYVSVRAVATNGLKSEFSSYATFSF